MVYRVCLLLLFQIRSAKVRFFLHITVKGHWRDEKKAQYNTGLRVIRSPVHNKKNSKDGKWPKMAFCQWFLIIEQGCDVHCFGTGEHTYIGLGFKATRVISSCLKQSTSSVATGKNMHG